MSTTETARVNPDRVRKMLKAERRRRGEDSNYYGPHTSIYHVARRFKITCAEVRKVAGGEAP